MLSMLESVCLLMPEEGRYALPFPVCAVNQIEFVSNSSVLSAVLLSVNVDNAC